MGEKLRSPLHFPASAREFTRHRSLSFHSAWTPRVCRIGPFTDHTLRARPWGSRRREAKPCPVVRSSRSAGEMVIDMGPEQD